MRILAGLILGVLVVGCGDLLPTPADQTAIKASPAKELTPEERKVVGTYETRVEGDTHRVVLLENGAYEDYLNGKKHEVEYEWKINKEGELIFEYKDACDHHSIVLEKHLGKHSPIKLIN